MKLGQTIKIIGINLILAILGTIVGADLYIKIFRPKLPMEVMGTSYIDRLNNAKKNSSTSSRLNLVVGDSFAHHQIGTNGNLFDSVFNCKGKSDCYYHNLAQSGEGLPFYWNSILAVLSNRNKSSANKVIVSVYFGNDIPFMKSGTSKKACSESHTFNQLMTQQHEDTFIRTLKRNFPSLLFIVRSLKASSGLGSKQNIKEIIYRAEALRISRSDPSKSLPSVRLLSLKLDAEVIQSAIRDVINPWEISLALANPYYYDELYNLKAEWSKSSVNCLTDNIISNINSIKRDFPNTEFLVVGIPDKFYWSESSYSSTVEEYADLGYKFDPKLVPSEIKNNQLSVLISNKFTTNGINYIYIPDLISPNTKIDDWFYYRDMHINAKGNQIISELLIKRGL